MRVPMRCNECQRPFASMDAPTVTQVRQMLAASPFAALAMFLPDDFAAELANMPIFVCAECSPVEVMPDG